MNRTEIRVKTYRLRLFFYALFGLVCVPINHFHGIWNTGRLAHMFADIESKGRCVKRIICHPKDFKNFILRLPEHHLGHMSLKEKNGAYGTIWNATVVVNRNQSEGVFTFIHE